MTHLHLVLCRAAGPKDTLHDAPFRFADQQTYKVNVVVNDEIR